MICHEHDNPKEHGYRSGCRDDDDDDDVRLQHPLSQIEVFWGTNHNFVLGSKWAFVWSEYNATYKYSGVPEASR